ncbi:MAG: hypothetical protein JOZ10_01400 [Acidobacteria bacterium]|nr:hypothetical protein [Acidobacteriota bacterium]MBV9146879.1 hypothetical protein [Acidobacteriota bacterium]MBV9436534.1 hypothetical protein [Acidobacteriota bacterium]
MVAFRHLRAGTWAALVSLLLVCLPCAPQSDRSIQLASAGSWHLHSRVPLGGENLILEPSHRSVQIMATAESPAFAGWTLEMRNKAPILVDSAGNPVKSLPKIVTFRVTATTRDKMLDTDSIPFDSQANINDFLLQMHFTLQVFRGIDMRTVTPERQWMIGIPANEPADERIYRVRFHLDDVRPEDRIVLLVTDPSGKRITKFHLEFL